ncbi:hypothetical protein GOODEAATRI_029901, partial [Goodea atripinnis]
AGLLQWTRLFPSLRHRGQNRPPVQPHPQAQTQQSTQPPLLENSPVAEEQVAYKSLMSDRCQNDCSFFCVFCSDCTFAPQVARLVEMGFSRIDALEALRASNNDINMATNFLLQH